MTMQILYLEEITGQSMIVNFGKKSVIEPVAQPSNVQIENPRTYSASDINYHCLPLDKASSIKYQIATFEY